MNLSIEQIFYGRGIYGYGILGASPGGRPFASCVEALCGMVGTPGVDYDGEPFLISVPESDCVVMICGRRGVPDSMGRSTLFFHALVAGRAEMANAKMDAFSLFKQGAFLDELPTGEIVPLRMDAKSTDKASSLQENFARMTMPCVIRSDKPQFNLVRAAVGNQALELSWATLAFQPMRNFEVMVLPSRVLCQRNVNEYDASGRLIRSSAVNSSQNEAEPPRECSHVDTYSFSGQVANVPPKDKSRVKLVLSVAINIVLAVVCAALLALRRTAMDSSERPTTTIVVTNTVETVVEKIVPAQLTVEQKSEIEDTAIMRYCSELRNKFPNENHIRDFDASAADVPNYEDIQEYSKFWKAKKFLDNLKAYVDFVNKEILEKESP